MTTLSAGAVEGIVNEIVTSDGGDRPVLQVAKFQPVGGANATRHKLWLTDGSRWVYAMAATQVHALLQEGGDFAPGCLVRLLKYSVNDMAGRKIVIVIDLEVAAGPQKLIGAPTGYPNGEALPSDAQPAGGGGAPVPQAAKKPTPAPARAAPRRPSAGGRAAMPIAELNPYQQRFCLRARVTSKSQMRYWDKPTSKGNLFSVDLLDASGEIRGTFFKETADKVFPILEEGKVYTFQETSGRLKPANKQYTSLSHEFELTFGNVTVEPCDDDAGISQIKGDWQPLSIFGDGGGPRDGNIDVVAIVRKAEPVGTIISSKSGKELTKREVVLCDDSGFDIRCTFWC